MGSSVVLTRIIPDAPSVYGVMALVFALYGGILLFSDIGVPLLLTQNRLGMEPAFRNTAWTAQVIRGLVIWLVAVALAPVLALSYPDFPGLQELIVVTSLAAILNGFNSTSLFAFSRNMEVKRLAKLELVSQLCGTIVTITHAYLDPTPWALVSGSLVTSGAKLLASHIAADRRDRFQWDSVAARQLMKIGGWVFISTALTFGCMQADRLVFAKLITKEELGVYAVALRLSMAAGELLRRMSRNVLFPILCRVHHEDQDLERSFSKHRWLVVASGGLLLTTMCGGGRAVMELLYVDKFAAGGWILQLLAAATWIDCCLLAPRMQAIFAMGQPRWAAGANAAKVLAMLTLIPIGFNYYGFLGAVAAYAFAEVPRYVITLWGSYACRVRRGGSDILLLLLFCATALAAHLMDQQLKDSECSALLRCVAACGLPLLAWTPVLLPALRRARSAPDSR